MRLAFWKGFGMADSKKYVVLHSIISGEHERGAVIDEAELGDTVTRLLNLGAIREATPAESALVKVDIADKRLNLSVQQIMNDKDAEITRLRARVVELEGQVGDLQSTAAPAAAPATATPVDASAPAAKAAKK